MESETPAWLNMLIAWAPFILLIGFWILYIRKGGFMSMQTRYWQRSLAFMDRQEQLLERIATALEERNKGGR